MRVYRVLPWAQCPRSVHFISHSLPQFASWCPSGKSQNLNDPCLTNKAHKNNTQIMYMQREKITPHNNNLGHQNWREGSIGCQNLSTSILMGGLAYVNRHFIFKKYKWSRKCGDSGPAAPPVLAPLATSCHLRL